MYIDAEALKKELTKAPVWTTLAVKEIIDETSKVDIVRCGECKWEIECRMLDDDNGYCSQGERKESE